MESRCFVAIGRSFLSGVLSLARDDGWGVPKKKGVDTQRDSYEQVRSPLRRVCRIPPRSGAELPLSGLALAEAERYPFSKKKEFTERRLQEDHYALRTLPGIDDRHPFFRL